METQVRKSEKKRAREATRNHVLASKTPEEIESYVDNLDLDGLKDAVKFLLLYVKARG